MKTAGLGSGWPIAGPPSEAADGQGRMRLSRYHHVPLFAATQETETARSVDAGTSWLTPDIPRFFRRGQLCSEKGSASRRTSADEDAFTDICPSRTPSRGSNTLPFPPSRCRGILQEAETNPRDGRQKRHTGPRQPAALAQMQHREDETHTVPRVQAALSERQAGSLSIWESV